MLRCHLLTPIFKVSSFSCVRCVSTMDYSRFLNQISSARKTSPLRALNGVIARSKIPFINMAGGLPNSDMFPFKSITATLRDGQQINIEGSLLSTALNYGPSEGNLKLVDLLYEYQTRLHNPPIPGKWRVAMTSGSQDAMCKAFEMTLNIGDYVIADEYFYPGTLAILKPYSTKHLKVKSDKDGMIIESLRAVLSRWNPNEIRNSRNQVPRILYTIPNGSNPTGTSISAVRKKEIYKIAQEYNLLIFEDDPYYFLSYGKEKVPSFLSMDVDGRVLRFDSFSKIMTSGLRLGYVTGPEALVDRIVLHTQASLIHCSNESQILVYETLRLWGYDKFIAHTNEVAKFYELRREKMIKYANKWLSDLAEWTVPSAGMFLWIRILGLSDTTNLVAFLPGKTCTIDETDTPYLRASFSVVSEADMDKGLEMLANCIKEELGTANDVRGRNEQSLCEAVYQEIRNRIADKNESK